jgi:hypothetical protein
MLRQRSIKTERQLCPQSGHLIGLQRMAAESPTCEFDFLAARACSGQIAADALAKTLSCGGKTSLSFGTKLFILTVLHWRRRFVVI